MPVLFDDGNTYIDFDQSALDNMAQMTLMFWVNFNSLHGGTSNTLLTKDNKVSSSGWQIYYNETAGKLYFLVEWTTQRGFWSVPLAASVDTDYHIAISYDRGATVNDPVIYIDSAIPAVTEILTPQGDAPDDSSYTMALGFYAASEGLDGTAWDLRPYDSILTAANVSEVYNRKSYILQRPLPIYRWSCLGAAGVQDFDGATLGATNYIIDDIEGAKGTPTNNPTGESGAALSYGGGF